MVRFQRCHGAAVRASRLVSQHERTPFPGGEPPPGADLTRAAGNADNARDSIGYLLGLPYLPQTDRAELERIAAFPSPRREAAAAAIAARLERDAVYIGFSDRATPELVSKRLGCVVDQPEYPGLDLASLCLRGG